MINNILKTQTKKPTGLGMPKPTLWDLLLRNTRSLQLSETP